ncbi:hypothetical protein TCAL_01652 [Tigriopus californicus]|uniref:C2H2-type domain-containing protein n=1 Tax=Tigriopus californicus TaxID=6832 RepID=A0A553PDI8_TIGCA|nr:zinc finger protein 112-like [Tigriopus californicus]TRY75739.1 hypothetical protein TCAL_01652 [Tigriopus californicus]
MTGGGLDSGLSATDPDKLANHETGDASSGSAFPSSAPLISIPWSNMEVSVSLLNTVSTQTYQVFPQLDDRLPSRKSLRTMKKLLALKQQQQQQFHQKHAHAPAKSNSAAMKAHATPLRPRITPRHAAATTPNEAEAGGGGGASNGMKCHFCGKSFSKATYLKRHIQSHSTVKPHKCDICGWGFYQQCNLKRHMASHDTATGEGFKCVHCPATFSTKSVLSVHMRDAHGSKREVSLPAGPPDLGSQITITPTKRVSDPDGSNAKEDQEPEADHEQTMDHIDQDEVEPRGDENDGEEEEIAPPSTLVSGHPKAPMSSEIPKGSTGGPCYTCTICQATFDKVSILNKHFKVHAGGGGTSSASPTN